MKGTNKVIAALTALYLTASALPVINAGAWYWQETSFDGVYLKDGDTYGYNGYNEVDGCTYYFSASEGVNSLLVRTDGTVPTAEDFAEYLSVSAITPWEEYAAGKTISLYGKEEGLCYCAIDDAENLYVVDVEEAYKPAAYSLFEHQELETIGRQLVLECDWITEASRYVYGCMSEVQVHSYQADTTEYTHEFFVTLPAGMECSDITELAECNPYLYRTDEDGSNTYLFDIIEGNTDGVTLAELSDAIELQEQLEAKYEGISCSQDYSHVDLAQRIAVHVGSIWQSAGDPNADGAVNSADAAELLVQAAENGAGASDKATADSASEAPDPAADINADGVVDALDASYILQYAAAEGAGAPVTWMELLK